MLPLSSVQPAMRHGGSEHGALRTKCTTVPRNKARATGRRFIFAKGILGKFAWRPTTWPHPRLPPPPLRIRRRPPRATNNGCTYHPGAFRSPQRTRSCIIHLRDLILPPRSSWNHLDEPGRKQAKSSSLAGIHPGIPAGYRTYFRVHLEKIKINKRRTHTVLRSKI
jgi:hypothetical protein